ncbi:hypothetical protein GCM10011578_053370 [Streptomyces fuscichromogenes]|uniref:Uncharacterized protein n=1 Tax=Streptomyces fuscichromogenes TaxID=1324013 RepID=A0A918CTE9_9ACTN|nr:hypothetical protein GCM10011578_053370 [Streptomyces fuscichromogenes]
MLAALEEDDALGGRVVDDDGGGRQGHGVDCRGQGSGLVVDAPLNHAWGASVGRSVGGMRQCLTCVVGEG